MHTLGFDLDDVVVDFNEGLRRYHNRVYSSIYTVDDIFCFELWKMVLMS